MSISHSPGEVLDDIIFPNSEETVYLLSGDTVVARSVNRVRIDYLILTAKIEMREEWFFYYKDEGKPQPPTLDDIHVLVNGISGIGRPMETVRVEETYTEKRNFYISLAEPVWIEPGGKLTITITEGWRQERERPEVEDIENDPYLIVKTLQIYQYMAATESRGFVFDGDFFAGTLGGEVFCTWKINDDYPYTIKTESGWEVAYPYEKSEIWKNSVPYARIDGVWHKCTAMLYDEKQALYRQPVTKAAWKITQGVNGGYPYIVYDEIPFYDEGGLNSGD